MELWPASVLSLAALLVGAAMGHPQPDAEPADYTASLVRSGAGSANCLCQCCDLTYEDSRGNTQVYRIE